MSIFSILFDKPDVCKTCFEFHLSELLIWKELKLMPTKQYVDGALIALKSQFRFSKKICILAFH